MTRSSTRLATAAVAVGGRSDAAMLAPRAQAAAATAQGVDPATRSTDEDDAGWTPEHYDFAPDTMVRRGTARRHGYSSPPLRIRRAACNAFFRSRLTHAPRTQLASRRTTPLDAACPMLPGLCAKKVVVSERSPSPPAASDDGSKDLAAAHARMCQARAHAQPQRACAATPGWACVAHCGAFAPAGPLYALAATRSYGPNTRPR